MKLRKVSGCDDHECPAVYVSDQGTAVVQGNPVTDAEGLTLGDGETAVDLPLEVILDAVKALADAPGNADAVERLREALGCS